METDIYNSEFVRKIDKKMIPTCNILGVNIAAINMNWLLDFTVRYIKDLTGDYMCVANVHTTVTAYEESSYRMIQNGGLMALPDGGPLSTLGRKRGYKNMERTTGPRYMTEILKISAEKGYRHYFYGSTEETLQKVQKKLLAEYPEVHVVGMYSPPFRKLTSEEEDAVMREINEKKPDFIWVGLGAPKQEKWMAAHQGKVSGFMVGVGAGFDYLAGNIQRAPEWMQMHNLEWLYRLKQEPRRLFRRYLHTNTKFLVLTILRGK